MCLGIPGKITEVTDGLLRMGTVDFGGAAREVCLAYVPDASINDYVVVHAGFAISQLDEQEAREAFELLRETGVLDKEWGEALFDDSGRQTTAQ